MRFGNPEALWLLLLVPVVAVWLGLGLRARRRALERFAAGPLVGRLVQACSTEVRVVKVLLMTGGFLFLVLALARPQWGTSLEQVARKGVDLIIGIDISESMLAEDIEPNRLRKSLEGASRLLDRLEGDRVGLLAYSGSSGVLCPLTLDYNAVRMFLDTLEPNMISYPGTSLASALESGIEAFGDGERKFQVMVLFGDGEDQIDAADVEKAAADAAQKGIIVHTVGVGSPSGAPIPERSERGVIIGYKKDTEGRVVTTRLQENTLMRIAEITGGGYHPASAAELELDRIAEAIGSMDKKEMQARLMTQFEERFQLPLAIGLAALLTDAFLSGRRRQRRGRIAGAGSPGTAGERSEERAA